MPDINKILARPENSVSSRYGAPMGQSNQIFGSPEKLYLQRIRFVDGDYSADGTYWGGGRDTPALWCAFSPEDTKNDVPIRVFVRARNREEAKQNVLDELNEEGFTFFR